MQKIIVSLFPVWALLLSLLALWQPWLFIGLKSSIGLLLALIMLSMGLTLSVTDFKRVYQNMPAVLLGLLIQYTIMPLLAFCLATLFQLTPELMVGVVLVGSVAGGTASNVMCYLARGDVALSVTMTVISTLIGVILTPWLTLLLAGRIVHVDVWGMLYSMVQIVLLPLLLGIALKRYLNNLIIRIDSLLPLISMACILLAIATVIALNKDNIQSAGLGVVMVVFLHNSGGLLLGALLPRWFGFESKVCRAISFEVGMQNSGLAVALALNYFSIQAALPGALFSAWQNISGAALASWWAKASGRHRRDNEIIEMEK